MAASKPNLKLRKRIELGIRLVAPGLDLMLAVAERLSRILAPDDPDYVPARMPHDGASAPRGLRRESRG